MISYLTYLLYLASQFIVGYIIYDFVAYSYNIITSKNLKMEVMKWITKK